MEKTDTRKLKPEVQEHLRKQVVRLRKAGKRYDEIGEIVGIHPTNACKIFKAYETRFKSDQSKLAGPKVRYSQDAESRLRKAITDKTPDQLKFPFALWTRKAVQELI